MLAHTSDSGRKHQLLCCLQEFASFVSPRASKFSATEAAVVFSHLGDIVQEPCHPAHCSVSKVRDVLGTLQSRFEAGIGSLDAEMLGPVLLTSVQVGTPKNVASDVVPVLEEHGAKLEMLVTAEAKERLQGPLLQASALPALENLVKVRSSGRNPVLRRCTMMELT